MTAAKIYLVFGYEFLVRKRRFFLTESLQETNCLYKSFETAVLHQKRAGSITNYFLTVPQQILYQIFRPYMPANANVSGKFFVHGYLYKKQQPARCLSPAGCFKVHEQLLDAVTAKYAVILPFCPSFFPGNQSYADWSALCIESYCQLPLRLHDPDLAKFVMLWSNIQNLQ